jgi:hypothetical protein
LGIGNFSKNHTLREPAAKSGVVKTMRRISVLLVAAAALIAGAEAAQAGPMPDFNPAVPSEHVREARYADTQPQRYPTTWGDEAAQSLGVQDGKWEAFRTEPTSRLEPSLNAGVDSGGAMLRLQWH